jgi:hypothetical protein
MGKMTAEDEMAAVLDLVQRIIAPQVDGCPVLRGELGCHDPGPVVEALAKDVGAEATGSGLERFEVRYPEESIIVLAEADPPMALG